MSPTMWVLGKQPSHTAFELGVLQSQSHWNLLPFLAEFLDRLGFLPTWLIWTKPGGAVGGGFGGWSGDTKQLIC